MASWLDRVNAQPLLGCEFEQRYVTYEGYSSVLRDLWLEWAREGRRPREVRPEGNARIQVETEDGIVVSVSGGEYENLVTKFAYKAELRERLGDAPVLVQLQETQRYSTLLAKVRSDSERFVGTLLAAEPRVLRRVGVVATCSIPLEGAPPGVSRFLDHLAAPWGPESLLGYKGRVTANLGQSETHHDRCHHHYDYEQERDEELDLKVSLDFQRYSTSNVSSAAELAPKLDEAIEAALAYFELFAEGDLTYAE